VAESKALEGIEVLLIDGNNLLHRVSGSADPTAQRTLIPRLRNALPSSIATTFMLDGRADRGATRSERIGKGMEVRHSGTISADDAIVRLLQDMDHRRRASVTVVTDDRALRDRARQMGALTQRLDWLQRLIELPPGRGTGIGGGAQPTPVDQEASDERPPWRPGRHATRKRGNPRRAPRSDRG
jgi:rRNA-processing protein FCF1